MKKAEVKVTDNDVSLLKGKKHWTPVYKSSLLKADEIGSLQIREVIRTRIDGTGIAFVAPEDEHQLPPQLKTDLLKRDPDNALAALSVMLEKFDSANENTPEFDQLPDKNLYIQRLQAIMDVIEGDADIRKEIEERAKGISSTWINTLRNCLRTGKFRDFHLHDIGKLIRAFQLAFAWNSYDKFEQAYIRREVQKTLENDHE